SVAFDGTEAAVVEAVRLLRRAVEGVESVAVEVDEGLLRSGGRAALVAGIGAALGGVVAAVLVVVHEGLRQIHEGFTLVVAAVAVEVREALLANGGDQY